MSLVPKIRGGMLVDFPSSFQSRTWSVLCRGFSEEESLEHGWAAWGCGGSWPAVCVCGDSFTEAKFPRSEVAEECAAERAPSHARPRATTAPSKTETVSPVPESAPGALPAPPDYHQHCCACGGCRFLLPGHRPPPLVLRQQVLLRLRVPRAAGVGWCLGYVEYRIERTRAICFRAARHLRGARFDGRTFSSLWSEWNWFGRGGWRVELIKKLRNSLRSGWANSRFLPQTHESSRRSQASPAEDVVCPQRSTFPRAVSLSFGPVLPWRLVTRNDIAPSIGGSSLRSVDQVLFCFCFLTES